MFLARIIDFATLEPLVTTFNNNVENMAQDRISNPSNPAFPDDIIIVDMQNGADLLYGNGSPGFDMDDDIHPKQSGYEKMATVWLDDALTTLLPKCP